MKTQRLSFGFNLAFIALLVFSCQQKKEETPAFDLSHISKYYKAAPKGAQTKWISSENKSGLKGQGGMTNKGPKEMSLV
jgi:hypothetical protein